MTSIAGAVHYVAIDEAARRLSLTPIALRARCRRAARREGRSVVACKFGRSWRVRFPPAAA